MKMLTTGEAAAHLGVTVQRVHQLIKEGALAARKMGRDYIIDEDDLRSVEHRPKVGRPRRAQAVKASKKASKKVGKS